MTSTPKKDNSKKHALTPDSKRHAVVIRRGTGKEKNTVYRNVSNKSSLFASSSSSMSVESSMSLNENAEVTNLKELICSVSSELDSVNKKLDDHLSGEEIHKESIKIFLQMQRQLQTRLQTLLRSNIYESCII